MIPCKTNKCLKYPVCRNKEWINCADLDGYTHDLAENNSESMAWDMMRNYFPNIKVISHLIRIT